MRTSESALRVLLGASASCRSLPPDPTTIHAVLEALRPLAEARTDILVESNGLRCVHPPASNRRAGLEGDFLRASDAGERLCARLRGAGVTRVALAPGLGLPAVEALLAWLSGGPDPRCTPRPGLRLEGRSLAGSDLDPVVDRLARDPETGLDLLQLFAPGGPVDPETAASEMSRRTESGIERIRKRLGFARLAEIEGELRRALVPRVAPLSGSGVPSTDTRPVPRSVRHGPIPSSVKDALYALVAGALAYERTLVDLPRGVEAEHIEQLERAAGEIERVVVLRPDLALRAHRIRALRREEPPLSSASLSAAGTSLLAALLGSGLGLRGEARRSLGRVALASSLPFSELGRAPVFGPRLDPQKTARLVEEVFGMPAGLEGPPAWWALAGSVAPTLGCDRERPALSRLLALASAFDLLVTGDAPGQKRRFGRSDALKTLARRGFDPSLVTVLTGILAAHR